MKNTVWVEKYRPQTVDEMILDEEYKTIFSRFVTKKDIPHLLFVGSAGVGKTTAAKAIARNISSEVLYICSSDHTSIDSIRNNVKTFCSTVSFGSTPKIVILDEADGLSSAAQQMLRNTLEEFVDNCRFILTANYDRKIIEPVQSRCQKFSFKVPDEKQHKIEILKKCHYILKTESIEAPYLKEDLIKLVNKTYPDIRKTINTLQKMTTDGKFTYQSRFIESDVLNNLITFIKQKDLVSVRKNIIGACDYEELYRTIFDRASEIENNKNLQIMMIVSEYLYRHALVIDPEINFVACIISIFGELP